MNESATKNYKILVFDIDDTLVVEKTSAVNGLRRILESQGKLYSDADFDRWVNQEDEFWSMYRAGQIIVPRDYDNDGIDQHGRNRRYWVRAQRMMRFLPELGSDLKTAYEILDLYETAKMSAAEAVNGGLNTIDYLSGKYALVAATDEVHDIAVNKLKLAGYDKPTDIFSPVITGCMKPKVEFFHSIFEKFGDNRQDYLMVGNSLKSDIQLAENLGIDSCLYNSWSEKDFCNLSPTFVINDLSELKKIL